MVNLNDSTDDIAVPLRRENCNVTAIPSSKPESANWRRKSKTDGNDKENTPCPNANADANVNVNAAGTDNDCDGTSAASTSTSLRQPQTQTTTPIAVAEPSEEPPTATVPPMDILSRPRATIAKEISKQVLRHKLQKLRHLVLQGVISSDYLDHEIFHPKLLEGFDPQTVVYNGGIANVKEWKISCYLEVMEGGIPCTNPSLELLKVFTPLLETCDDLFLLWYKQQHACNSSRRKSTKPKTRKCSRLMTFVTRYTPAPGEQALLKHVDGAGKVDGSCVVALPVDRWSAPESEHSWYGHGGGLTFWDGREPVPVAEEEAKTTTEDGKDNELPNLARRKPRFRPKEIHYETRSGDIAFIDRAVWHQADPITKGTRWALVIFYKVTEEDEDENETETETKGVAETITSGPRKNEEGRK